MSWFQIPSIFTASSVTLALERFITLVVRWSVAARGDLGLAPLRLHPQAGAERDRFVQFGPLDLSQRVFHGRDQWRGP